MGRAPKPPSQMFPQSDEAMFYTLYFAKHDRARQELERDVEATLRKIYFAASGEAGPRDDPATPNPFGMVSRTRGLLDGLPDRAELPAWLSRSDFDVMVASFRHSGFGDGLNYYRNLDRNWSQMAPFEDLRVEVPAVYLVGERDPGRSIPGMDQIVAAMPSLATSLRDSVVIPQAGHWLQQEAPDAVNNQLLKFLTSLAFGPSDR